MTYFVIISSLIILVFYLRKKYKTYISEMPEDREWTQVLKSPEGKEIASRECEERWSSAGWFWGPIDKNYYVFSAATSWRKSNGEWLSDSDVKTYVKVKKVEGFIGLIENK